VYRPVRHIAKQTDLLDETYLNSIPFIPFDASKGIKVGLRVTLQV
jgi:hypothetical protein